MKNENGNTFIERLRFENEIYELENERLYNIFKDSFTKYKNKRSLTNLKRVEIATEKWAKSQSKYFDAQSKYFDASRRLRNASKCHTAIEKGPLRVV